MNYENILIELENNIAILTINRPGKNKEIQVILITGSGEKAFVAGADISEFAHFTIAEGAQLASEGQEKLFDLIENLKTPVIAAINGFALGGGLELAMSCHFRIASDNAKMGLPEYGIDYDCQYD